MKFTIRSQFLFFVIHVVIVFSRMGPKPKPEFKPGAKGEPDKEYLGKEPLDYHGYQGECDKNECICFKPEDSK